MYQATTPTISITVEDEDITLSTLKEIWVTLKTMNHQKTFMKSKSEVFVTENDTTKKIEVPLSQDDTLAFDVGRLLLQVQILDNNNLALSSNILDTSLKANLKDGKIYV